jgi:uncharacterized protein (TIRG00374 family)
MAPATAADAAVRGSAGRLVWRVAGAAVAVLLLATVLKVAGPSVVWQLLRSTDAPLLAAAASASAAFLALRGLRLRLLLAGGSLGRLTAIEVAAAAQAAALFAPARTGELALPWLLTRATGRPFSSNVGTLLAARVLDLAALGVWCGAAILVIWGLGEPLALVVALLLLAPTLLLPTAMLAADRLVIRWVAPRGMVGRRWARRLRRVRGEIDTLRARPARLWGAVVTSFLMWGLQWSVAWLLLLAMGYSWPFVTVSAGASAAAVANLLPFNLFGNLGTLEAGWTAAFAALGIPVQTAAASGLAAHLWGLIFAAFFGIVGWAALSFRGGRS